VYKLQILNITLNKKFCNRREEEEKEKKKKKINQNMLEKYLLIEIAENSL